MSDRLVTLTKMLSCASVEPACGDSQRIFGFILQLAEIVAEMQEPRSMVRMTGPSIHCDCIDVPNDRHLDPDGHLPGCSEGMAFQFEQERKEWQSQVYKQTETIERLLGELESVTRERDELRDGFESFKTGQAAFAGRLTNERDAARASLAANEAALNDSWNKAAQWQQSANTWEQSYSIAVNQRDSARLERDGWERNAMELMQKMEGDRATLRDIRDQYKRWYDGDRQTSALDVLDRLLAAGEDK